MGSNPVWLMSEKGDDSGNQRKPKIASEPPGAEGPGADHPLARSSGAQPCWCLDLGPLFSRTMRQYILLFKPLSLWYLVIAGLAKEHSHHTPSHKSKRQKTNHHPTLLPFFHPPSHLLNKFSQFWLQNHSWIYFIIISAATALVQGLLPQPRLLQQTPIDSPASSLTPSQSTFCVARRSWK